MMAARTLLIEGVAITLLRDRLQPRLHLPPRRGRPRLPPPAARGRGGLRRRATSARTSCGSGFDLDVTVHAGAGAYICGEETALLDSLEGRRGQPRLKPPFPGRRRPLRPADVGQQRRVHRLGARDPARRAPTGSPAWAPRSPPASASSACPGTSSDPGQYEAPLGITLRELLDMAGGMRDPHKKLKFWTPGGSSTPIFTDEHLDVPLDFESVAAAGSMLGTRALQIFDETTSVVRAVDALDRLLRARVLRQVHPVPRGHVVAEADHGPPRARPGHAGRHRQARSTSATTSSAALLRPR